MWCRLAQSSTMITPITDVGARGLPRLEADDFGIFDIARVCRLCWRLRGLLSVRPLYFADPQPETGNYVFSCAKRR